MSPTSGYDPSTYRHVLESRFTYLAGFHRNVHRFADAPALSDPATGRQWTYAELGRQVRQLAFGLRRCGVEPGEAVVYQLMNSPEFALLYLATQELGAVGVPINFRLAAGETAHILDDARPRVYLFDTGIEPMAQEALALAVHTPATSVAVDTGAGPGTDAGAGPMDTSGGQPAAVRMSFAQLLRPVPEDASDAARPEGDGGLPGTVNTYQETTRLYTSGTTGMPKGVPLPSVAEVLTAHDVIMHFPLAPGDRTLNMTPWFHRGGLYAGGPNPAFYVGAHCVTLRVFDADTCLDLVAEWGLQFLIGAPTNLAALTAAQQERPRDLSSLKGIITMGAPLEREASLRYQAVLTKSIFNGYGTTESFWNTFLRPGDFPDFAGSAGRACTDDDVAVVRIFDDRTAEPHELAAKDGQEVGEVIVRSVKGGYAYVNSPEEAAQRFRGEWLYLGDLATWDASEYVTVVGRKDDMIITGGENVHPVQVEEALNSHPAVRDSAVVGVPDDTWGQRVVAYVVPQAGSEPDVSDLDSHCRTHPMLAAYKRPRAYRLVTELPMTATGKKVHYQLRQQAIEDLRRGAFDLP